MNKVWIVAVILSVVTAVSAVRADSYQELLKYRYGQGREAVADIEDQMKGATGAASQAIEAKLLVVLQSPEATPDAKEIACRLLRQVGSAKCVPALAALLGDEKFSHMARWALQGNPSVEAGAALRNALATTKGKLLVGVIGSVGARPDAAAAVGALEKLAKDADAAVAGAALISLGHIGDAQAAKAIESAKTAGGATLKAWAEATLECADRLAKGGDAAGAAKISRGVYENTAVDSGSRIGAFIGWARGGQMPASELMAALKGNNGKLQIAAAQLAGAQKDAGTIKMSLDALPSLPATVQMILVAGFAANSNTAAAGAIATLAEAGNADVNVAAVRALGKVGDASQVPLLIKFSLGSDEKASAATESLTQLRGEKVGAELLKLLKGGTPVERAKAVEIIAARGDRGCAANVFAACRDEDKKVRIAAYKALRILADANSLENLADLLVATKSDGERYELEQTMIAVALRGQNADAVSGLLIGKLGKSPDADPNLLNVLAKRGGTKALEAVRKTFATGNADQKKAAVRAMSVWADTTTLKDLLSIAQTDASAANQALALRGYVRLVADAGGSADEKVKMYKSALNVTKQADAIKQVLGGLGEVRDMAALKLAADYLGNAEVVNEAAAAVLSNSRGLMEGKEDKKGKKRANLPPSQEIREMLEKVAASQANQALRQQVTELLNNASTPVEKPKKKKK